MNKRKKTKEAGALVISLDFEMFWGIADFADIHEWTPIVERVHVVVPRLLELFQKYGVHATWATVGALMCEGRSEFLERLPKPVSPQTKTMLDKLGFTEQGKGISCPEHILFAPELVRMAAACEGQEIGTHTFSHYYCDDPFSSPEEFAAELAASQKIAEEKGYPFISAVFPRNQISDQFVNVLQHSSLRCFRGVEHGWIAKNRTKLGMLGIILWYLNNYIPIARTCSFFQKDAEQIGCLMNIRNSRFYKPYRPQYAFAERLKLWRYKLEMKSAAKRGEIYHMYWHPHNFAENTEVNFQQMGELLSFYIRLRDRYGMISLNMSEIYDKQNQDLH